MIKYIYQHSFSKIVLVITILFFTTYSGKAQETASEIQSNINYDTTSLIVRFNHKLLNWDVIDDDQISLVNVGSLLNEQGRSIASGMDFYSFELEPVIAKKLFSTLSTKDSISRGRQGQDVIIPPFWATFSLQVPEGVRFIDFASELRTKYPLVIYAHPNFYVDLNSCNPTPEDTLYDNQNTIYDNGSGFEHIHVDSAWCMETGDRYIKVGIFDSGIDSTHEDLTLLTGRAANNHLSTDQYGNIVYPKWGEDWDNHGTKVAGIIGAKRNNITGIAGIAGGDGTDTSGVSLLDFRFTDNTGGNVYNVELLSVMIIDAARYVGSYYDWADELDTILDQENLDFYKDAPGYGIHIGNHSYAIRLGNAAKNEEDPSGGSMPGGFYESCNLCYESFLFSLRNGVVNVTASGNKALETGVTPQNYEVEQYPSAYPDSWTIRVGSSAYNGDVLVGGQNANNTYFSIWADNVDVIAPGDGAYNYTTWSVNIPNTVDSIRYGTFNGTSSATPHVSGVAALLLSYYNERMCYSNINLDVADVEYILEKSADTTSENINSGGFSPGSGWGRVNAEKAIKMIDFPELQIVHPDDIPINQQTIAVDTIVIYYAEPIMETSNGPISSQWPIKNNRPYKVARHKVQATYNFGIYRSDTTELLDTWVRHSRTNSIQEFNDTVMELQQGQSVIVADYFRQDPMAVIDSVVNDSLIYLSGYYYQFIRMYDDEDLQNLNIAPQLPVNNFWYPTNPNVDPAEMRYSIYIRDTTLAGRYEFPCDSINELLDLLADVTEVPTDKDLLIYPNPTNTVLNIKLPGDLFTEGIIQIADVQGRLINELELSGDNVYTLDVRSLKSGVYFLNLSTYSGDFITKTWIKQ